MYKNCEGGGGLNKKDWKEKSAGRNSGWCRKFKSEVGLKAAASYLTTGGQGQTKMDEQQIYQQSQITDAPAGQMRPAAQNSTSSRQ